MSSKRDLNFFSHFTPVLRDGRIVRSESGLIMFVRLKDGKCVGFRDDQVDMKALENHVGNPHGGGSSSSTGHFNLDKQAPINITSHVLSQADRLTSGPSNTAVQDPVQCSPQQMQSNLTLPQTSSLQQSNGLSSLVSDASSLPASSQGSSQEFGQLQLSLQDMPGMKSFISGLGLDQHQLQNPQGSQQQQLSPSCDRDLQSFADLVSKTLEQEEQEDMQVDFSETPEEEQQQQRPKSAADVSISLSPLGQPTFHLDMEKATSSHNMLMQPHALSLASSSIEEHGQALQNFSQQQQQHQQQNLQHQTLAPIQTLLNSLRQKGDRQGSGQHTSASLLTSSHSHLPSETYLTQQFDIHHSQSTTHLQKPAEDKEMEDFFKSVAFHLDDSHAELQLGTTTEHDMQVLHVSKKDQQQQLQQHQKSSSHLSQPVSKGVMRSQIVSAAPASRLNSFTDSKIVQSATPPVNNQTKCLNNISARPASSPIANVRPASLPPINVDIINKSSTTAQVPGTPPIISNGHKNVSKDKCKYPAGQALTNDPVFLVGTPPISTTSGAIRDRATTVINSSRLSAFPVSAPSSTSTFVTNPLKDRAIPTSGVFPDKTGVTVTVGNKASVSQPVPSSVVPATVDSPNIINCSSNSSITASPAPDSSLGDQIWMNLKTPHARLMDKKATQALIQLVRQPLIRAKLASTHIKKKDVWNEIGQEMRKQGFVFSNAGEKCSQKWRNMERTFNDYELSKDIPSLKHKKQPDFYCELSALLNDKQDYKGLLNEEGYKKKLVDDYMETTYHQDVPDEESHTLCQITIGNMSSSAATLTTPSATSSSCVTTSAIASKVSAVNTLAAALSVASSSSLPLSLSSTPTDSSPSKQFPGTVVTSVLESPSWSQSSIPSSLVEDKVSRKTESLEAEVKRLQGLVETQNKEIQRMSEVLGSVQTLLREQRRDGEAVRIESGRRFSELKTLIGQNQREKMKFMYDFLRALKPGHQPKRIKSHPISGNQGSA